MYLAYRTMHGMPPTAKVSPPDRCRLILSGAPRVVLGKKERPLKPQYALLLAWLAIEGPTARARLGALMFPQADEAGARNNLRQRLFQLKKRLGTDVVVGDAVLQIAPEVSTDIVQDPSGGAELLGGVSADDLEELGEWLGLQRRRRETRRAEWLAAAADQAEADRDLPAALEHAAALVQAQPESEHAHRCMMRLHYLRGDRAAALQAFDRCEQILKNELGARPGEETLDLLRQIESSTLAVSESAARPVPATVLRPPRLVGRDAQWKQLHAVWASGGVLLVSGEGGMGKSRLLGDFAAATDTPPGRVLVVGARSGDALLPYALLSRCLRAVVARPNLALPGGVRGELARLLPELGEARALQSGADRTRFVNAVEATLRQAAANGLEGVLIDDLHLADDASTELLQQLCCGSVLRWLIAFRDAELRAPGRALAEELTRSRRSTTLALAPLTVAQVAELLASLGLAGWGGDDQAAQLHRHTGGNPMYLLETVKAMLSGAVAPDGAQRTATLPAVPSVSQVILQRIGALSAAAVKLARCAAVAGQDFSAALASSVLQLPPLDLADTWSELEAAQVLCDGAFAHDLIYEAALASVPAPIARELHLQIARFLESRPSDAGRIASHWLAGDDPLSAVPHLRTAATLAAQRFRFVEAAQNYERAANILEAAGDRRAAFEAYFAAAKEIGGLGADARLLAYADRLEALAEGDAEIAQAAVVRVAIDVWAGRLDDVMAAAQRALEPARRAGAAEAESELHYALAVVHWERRALPEAVAHSERALELCRGLPLQSRRADHAERLITLTLALGTLRAASGRLAEAVALTSEAYRLAVDAGQPHSVVAATAHLCRHAIEQGELTRALEWSERGVQASAAAEVNVFELESLMLARSDALLLAGQWGQALEQYDELVRKHERDANWMSADIVSHRALLHFLLGRHDLARKALRKELSLQHTTAVKRLALEVTLVAFDERGDGSALIERVAGIEDVGLRSRLLVRLAPHCEPGAVLPVLGIAAASARDTGRHGLWLSLQSRCAERLAAAGRHDAAAAAARQAWQRSEAGITPSHPFPEMAADLCAALAAQNPDLARAVFLRAEGWLQAASSTLPAAWRENCLSRSPLRTRLMQATRRLGAARA